MKALSVPIRLLCPAGENESADLVHAAIIHKQSSGEKLTGTSDSSNSACALAH